MKSRMVLKVVTVLMVLFVVFKNLSDAYIILTGTSWYPDLELCDESTVFMGWLSVLSAILILIPTTFVMGNLLTVSKIMLLIGFNLVNERMLDAFLEVPFLLLVMVLLRFNHPLSNRYQWNDMMIERNR